MVEIIALYRMSQRLAEIVKEKGRKPTWFVVMLIGFWFLGEIIGAITGTVVCMLVFKMQEPNVLAIWPFSIATAAFGAFCAFQIAKNLSPE